MALTDAQTVFFEERLGTPLDSDLEARLTRNGGPGYEGAVVVEVLKIRVASMKRNPLQFSIPGDYSENREKNLAALMKDLTDAENEAGIASGSQLVGVEPACGRWGRGSSYAGPYDVERRRGR